MFLIWNIFLELKLSIEAMQKLQYTFYYAYGQWHYMHQVCFHWTERIPALGEE